MVSQVLLLSLHRRDKRPQRNVMWNKYFKWTTIKPIEEEKIDRPEEKGRIKRMKVSWAKRAWIREWLWAQGQRVWYWSFNLFIWSNDKTHGVTQIWWLKTEQKWKVDCYRDFKKWDTSILDKLSTWTNSKILGRIRAEKTELNPYVKGLQPFQKHLLNQV